MFVVKLILRLFQACVVSLIIHDIKISLDFERTCSSSTPGIKIRHKYSIRKQNFIFPSCNLKCLWQVMFMFKSSKIVKLQKNNLFVPFNKCRVSNVKNYLKGFEQCGINSCGINYCGLPPKIQNKASKLNIVNG